ncbi:cell division control protein Cdc6 [Ascodesmis nigricans]|uniref:Cell division control protein n=1 Tax=Ascodesmis nigricans TaxID=341454 RepID=A0A4S2N6L7_9PEZI|nr:cell division control protein Cdc6 [Ascodesmis nigricans]
MAAAVLGKRTRSHTTIEVVVSSPARSTRSMSRSTRSSSKQVTILDEGEDGCNDDAVMLDFSKRSPKRARCEDSMSPSSTGDKRIPLSPQKVNTLFQASKSTPVEPECPETPRHRDRVVKPVTTPRHKDRGMKPVATPQHRVKLVGKPLTPRSRMGTATPTAGTPKSVITTAKALFSRSMSGGKIIGRDTEKTRIQQFVSAHIETREGGCLYVSGPPGCGKSALLTEVMGELVDEESKRIKQHWVNCMSLPTPSAIYTNILDSISPSDTTFSSSDPFTALESLVTSSTPNDDNTDDTLYILVLDEIDHLLTQDHLSTLFSLSFNPSSRLLLIGIANALDLTDRFLPRLKARGLEPELLPFLPYTAAQISQVITSRLRSLLSEMEREELGEKFTPFVHPAAIMLLSKKIEAATGDLRKAFDILRRTLELVEMEEVAKLGQSLQSSDNFKLPTIPASPTSRPALSEISNAASLRSVATSGGSQMPNWTPATAPRATLGHISRACATSLGSSLTTRILSLPSHVKAVLCILVSSSSTSSASAISVVKLRELYARKCSAGEGKMQKLGQAEMRGVVERLEAAGCIDVVRGTGKGRGKKALEGAEEKLKSRVGRMEVLTALGGEGVVGRELFMELLE